MDTSMIRWPKVILYGDSLIQRSFDVNAGCWASMLSDRLQRKCDVLTRGFSGYTTRFNKVLLPRLINQDDSPDIALFMIFLGANDSNLEANILQHVPLVEYQDNLTKMVEYLMVMGISNEKIILIGPPPCDESGWGLACKNRGSPMTKSNSAVNDYSQRCQKVAQECGVHFVELYDAMMRQENWSHLFCDGLHFSLEGAKFLTEHLWPCIEKKTAHLPFLLPLYDDIDAKNPEKSLLLSDTINPSL